MNQDKFLRLGVVGCGQMAKEFKLISKLVNKVKIITGTDTIIKRAQKIAGKNHAYTSVQEMYDNEDIDAVYIATPHNFHKSNIKQAFENGKHVLCEKPVAATLDDAREIHELDKKYKSLKLGFNYQYRYDKNAINMIKGLNSNRLGNIYYFNCNIYFSRDLNYFNTADWRIKKSSAGGGTLLIHGSHIMDIIIWALGEPKSVIGKIATLKFKNIEVEDIGFGIIEFEKEILGQINCSMIPQPQMRAESIDLAQLELFGERGRLNYSCMWPSALKWYGISDSKINENEKNNSYMTGCIEAFIDWIIHDIPFYNTVEESSKVLRFISAIYRSSETEKKELIEKL
ncbi:MAG: Gfo/Idh/MocA family protein [Candidatus Heimdallarchaeota archaeon]